MSSHALNWSFQQPLPSDSKLVLLSLADRADPYGRCYRVATVEIAKLCGLSESTTVDCLKQLCTNEIIRLVDDAEYPFLQGIHSYLLLLNHPIQAK